MTRLTEYYAYTEEGPEGVEGVIFTFIPIIGMSGQLAHRNVEICRHGFRDIAVKHQKRSGYRVRLVKFSKVEDIEEVT